MQGEVASGRHTAIAHGGSDPVEVRRRYGFRSRQLRLREIEHGLGLLSISSDKCRGQWKVRVNRIGGKTTAAMTVRAAFLHYFRERGKVPVPDSVVLNLARQEVGNRQKKRAQEQASDCKIKRKLRFQQARASKSAKPVPVESGQRLY